MCQKRMWPALHLHHIGISRNQALTSDFTSPLQMHWKKHTFTNYRRPLDNSTPLRVRGCAKPFLCSYINTHTHTFQTPTYVLFCFFLFAHLYCPLTANFSQSLCTHLAKSKAARRPLWLSPCTKCFCVLVLGFMHEWRSTLQNMRLGFREKIEFESMHLSAEG